MTDLSRVERAIILNLYTDGDNVPSNIADNIPHHAKSVSRSLADLEDMQLVTNKGRGVWTLTDDGLERVDDYIHELPQHKAYFKE